MKIKAVLFDMDGTLIDTFGQMKKEEAQKKPNIIERYINRRVEQLPSYSYSSMMKMIEEDPLLHMLQRKVKKSFDERLRSRYRKADMKLGAKDFLEKLNKQGIMVCLCTNNARHMVDQILHDQGIETLFQEIITCYDVEKPKPDPEMYITAMKRLHMEPQDCLVFEDMLEGVDAARGAGIEVIAVYDAYNQKDAKEIAQKSKFVIQDYKDERLHQIWEAETSIR